MNAMMRWGVTRAAISILLVATMPIGTGRGDIFQWQYINRAHPSQGKQQSVRLCPDGALALRRKGEVS